MAEVVRPLLPSRRWRAAALLPNLDYPLIGVIAALMLLGVVMVTSASMVIGARELGDPLYHFRRQLFYVVLGFVAAAVMLQIPLVVWRVLSGALLAFAIFLLVLVLVPGVGREANGAVRWLPLLVFNLQVSEVAKGASLIYLADYLVRRQDAVRATGRGFLIPIAILSVVSALLLAEPNFGAAAVIMATALTMLFIAGAPLWRFALLVGVVGGAGALLIVTSPYRWERMTAFLNPWADPFDSGFQLTQALIAIGRGGWFGVGLGNSVQKLFYLPEAHTDFVFAVLAEELGLVAVLIVIALYGFVVWRSFRIGARSMALERPFGAYLAYGTGIWFGIQVVVNMGVNMGVLPTKGLTLPLLSYGGSSLVMTAVALALLLRVDHEARIAAIPARSTGGRNGTREGEQS